MTRGDSARTDRQVKRDKEDEILIERKREREGELRRYIRVLYISECARKEGGKDVVRGRVRARRAKKR